MSNKRKGTYICSGSVRAKTWPGAVDSQDYSHWSKMKYLHDPQFLAQDIRAPTETGIGSTCACVGGRSENNDEESRPANSEDCKALLWNGKAGCLDGVSGGF